MSDKGNDLTISDILKKIMELSKTNDDTSSETERSTPGSVVDPSGEVKNKTTNGSPKKKNDNKELKKLLFANRSMVPLSEHPDREVYFYPSVTPSQILTGPPQLKGRGRPQHQSTISRENGNTIEMPMSFDVRDCSMNLPIKNEHVQNYPVPPPGQITQTTTYRNITAYPAAPPPTYRPEYPNGYCPDAAVFLNGNGRSIPQEVTGSAAVVGGMNNVLPPGYVLRNPNQKLTAQDLSQPLDSFHRPSAVTRNANGNVTYNGLLPPPERAAVNYSIRPEAGLQHEDVMNRNEPPPRDLPQNNHVVSERTANRKPPGGAAGSPRTRSRLGMQELLKRFLEDKLDEVPPKRSKLSSNIPHLEKVQ